MIGTKHPWVKELIKGIQVCSNEGPCPYPRGDDNEIVKIVYIDEILKIFSRTAGPKFVQMKGPALSRMGGGSVTK